MKTPDIERVARIMKQVRYQDDDGEPMSTYGAPTTSACPFSWRYHAGLNGIRVFEHIAG